MHYAAAFRVVVVLNAMKTCIGSNLINTKSTQTGAKRTSDKSEEFIKAYSIKSHLASRAT